MKLDRRALFFGDELVAGVGDPTGLGWVGRVTAACHEHGIPLLAYNLGVARETAVQTTLRLISELMPRYAPEADCRVVLCTTVNDVVARTEERATGSVESALLAYQRALDHLEAIGIPTFVVGPPGSASSRRESRTSLLAREQAQLARARGVPYLDLAGAELEVAHENATSAASLDVPDYRSIASAVLAGGLLDWLRAAVKSNEEGESQK